MAPVALHLPDRGSYSSAAASAPSGHVGVPRSHSPPATRTLPFASSVAVNSARAVIMLPVTVHVPTAGAADCVGSGVEGEGVGEASVSPGVAGGTVDVAAGGVAEAQPESTSATAPSVARRRIAIPPNP